MAKPLSKEELLAQFDDLGDDDLPAAAAAATATQPAPADATAKDDDDPVAELAALAAAKPPSRAATPKLSSSSNASNRSPRRTGQVTPSSTGSTRNSEDKGQRKSQDGTRSYHQGVTPVAEQDEQKQSSGGGWWGSIISTASAAAKQAESALKEIQKNEEAQKWAEQVKGNVGLLRSYGDELRSRAVPTFTQLLHTLAPPISQHERLQIHITHDLHNYPSLDPIIYATFSRVMAQVEGGDLMVIQRGSESRQGPDAAFTGGSTAGWTDGPWWRDVGVKRDLGAVKGLVEGTKLVRVSAESYATDFFAGKGGVEEAAKAASEVLSETNPVRSSDIFLAIQAISHSAPGDLFGGSAAEKKAETGGVEEPEETDDLVSFAVHLYDPIHSISFHALSQAFPQKWADWLDASPAAVPEGSTDPVATLPQEIKEIIESGGVDPREWVAEWMEEIIQLAVGVVAQRYVARRMGVGEGGIGRGKARQRAEESGGGEAARAI
ncbi:putative maintenance of telomere capping protein 1 protein [Neofusicoccum parvum UCRNP2]|uniref:Putative maintenance of telomere capping protein 1 protein n=1 Tax=Botryosphaeria parva (strain UCR-NP2) TaxID=1287680 RepID=R1EL19_BOTPV|nr:putative maintenance of telomere capping protein 1 protein [Neofusicoccum parvum UCRNP2]